MRLFSCVKACPRCFLAFLDALGLKHPDQFRVSFLHFPSSIRLRPLLSPSETCGFRVREGIHGAQGGQHSSMLIFRVPCTVFLVSFHGSRGSLTYPGV